MKALAGRAARLGGSIATLAASAAMFLAASTVSFAQSQPEYSRWWLPENVSSQGVHVDRIFYVILVVTVAVFVLVQATLIVFLVKYRRRDGQRAAYVHGNNRLEIIWTAVPALFLGVLIFLSQRAWSEIRPAKFFRGAEARADVVLIEVVAQQFVWNIRYPGPDGVFGRRNPALVSNTNAVGVDLEDPYARDDITRTNQLHVPVGKVVQIRMTSLDVLHSFFLPDLRVKQDAVPGMLVNIFFQVNKAGLYEIACAELCGLGHYRMKGFLTVHDSDESFQAWLADNARTPAL